MFRVDFMVMLCENAKIYKYHNLKDLISDMGGRSLYSDSVFKIIESYIEKIKEVEKDKEAIDWINKQFEEYKKIFPNNLFRNYEINGFDGFYGINENNANAILLDFINYLSSKSLVDIVFTI